MGVLCDSSNLAHGSLSFPAAPPLSMAASTENGTNLYEVQYTRLFPVRIIHITKIVNARD